jgi:ABC-type dipeptide/oligopeptide/nickel transport system ATPase subunit
VKSYANLESRMVNVDRCLKVLEIAQEQTNASEERQNFFLERPNWPESGRVEFENVYLKYDIYAENGSNLSSGEKQLICICRAILRVRLDHSSFRDQK